MGAAGLASGGLTMAGAGVSAYGQGITGKAQANYLDYLSSTASQNAGLAKAEGQSQGYAINEQALVAQRGLTSKIQQTVGAQVAGSVSGAGASSRTAQDIVRDTMNKGELDQEALDYNTNIKARNANISSQMQAFNYQGQAAGYAAGAGNAIAASKIGQVSSILGGASSVANTYWLSSIYGANQQTGGNMGNLNPINPAGVGDGGGMLLNQ